MRRIGLPATFSETMPTYPRMAERTVEIEASISAMEPGAANGGRISLRTAPQTEQVSSREPGALSVGSTRELSSQAWSVPRAGMSSETEKPQREQERVIEPAAVQVGSVRVLSSQSWSSAGRGSVFLA